GVEGGLAAGLEFVGGVEGVEVEVGDEVQQEEDEVAVGEAAGGRHRLPAVSLGVPGAILLAPWGSHVQTSCQERGRPPASTEDDHGWRPESPADRIKDHG